MLNFLFASINFIPLDISGNIVESIVNAFKNSIPSELIIFLISLLPILELRGGILAAKFLSVPWVPALIICMIGNLLPIPFILLFAEKILNKLKNTRFVKWVDKIEARANKKAESILKYERFGLFLFVAIPLPGTGAWTGALIAALLRLNLKDSMISITAGVLTAGLIMSLISYGIIGQFC